jgi:hypothetical protein
MNTKVRKHELTQERKRSDEMQIDYKRQVFGFSNHRLSDTQRPHGIKLCLSVFS